MALGGWLFAGFLVVLFAIIYISNRKGASEQKEKTAHENLRALNEFIAKDKEIERRLNNLTDAERKQLREDNYRD